MTYIPGDCSIGAAAESTFGTYATVARFLEFTDESLDVDKQIKQGAGLRVGGRLDRSARRVVISKDVKGDIGFEQVSKGTGLFWAAAFGSGTSTVVSGATYQQLFTFGDVPGSLSVQKCIPQADGATLTPYTALGCMVDSWEMSCANGDLMKAKLSLKGKSLTTAQAAETVSYVAAPTLYHFAQGSVSLAGTLTAPTATALASSASPTVGSVRSFELKVDNKLSERRNFGNAGALSKPTVGMRSATLKMTLEFDQTTWTNNYLNDTAMSVLLDFDTGVALSSGTERLQIAVPVVKLNGEVPKSNGGDLVTIDCDCDILDGLVAASPIYMAMRTSDTAL